MAKVTVVGQAVVLTSAVKLDDLKMVAKYRPEALVLKGGEDGKEKIFSVQVSSSEECVSKYGAAFKHAARGTGFAEITLPLASDAADIKDQVADQLGGALTKLNALEATLPTVIAEIAAEKATVLSNITVVGEESEDSEDSEDSAE